MLNVFLNCKDVKNCHSMNDALFNRYIAIEVVTGKDVKKVIRLIDDVEYIGNNRFISKFEPGVVVSVRELSTGCKTALNILLHPDEVFSVAECGDNALQVIFNYKEGNILLPYFVIPYSFVNDIKVIYHNESVVVRNNKELESILSERF